MLQLGVEAEKLFDVFPVEADLVGHLADLAKDLRPRRIELGPECGGLSNRLPGLLLLPPLRGGFQRLDLGGELLDRLRLR